MSVTIFMLGGNGQSVEVAASEFTRRHAPDPRRDARLVSIRKDSSVPKVGDTVRFNDHGLEMCFGSAFGKSAMKRLELRITHVDAVSMTYPKPTFVVEVDDPEINQLMIDHNCFDIVRSAA